MIFFLSSVCFQSVVFSWLPLPWLTLFLSNTMWHSESKMSLHECVFLWKPIRPTSPPISSAAFIRKTTWFSHFKALADSGCWHKRWCIVHKACASMHVYVWHNFSDEEQASGKMLGNNSYNHHRYVWYSTGTCGKMDKTGICAHNSIPVMLAVVFQII